MQFKNIFAVGFFLSSLANSLPAGIRESESLWKGSSSNSTLNLVSFGDSIASGFSINRIFKRISGGTYADKAGKAYSQKTGKNVQVYNLARVGYRIQKIYDLLTKTHLEKVQNADYILLQGGGVNFFLDANFSKQESPLPELNKVTTTTQRMLQFARKHQKNGALIGIYFPHLENFKNEYQLRIIDTLAQANWKNRLEAKKLGYKFIDVYSQLNCTLEGQSLCRIENAFSLNDYKKRLLIAHQNKNYVGMKKLGLAQRDNIHPNSKGHSLIATEIFF